MKIPGIAENWPRSGQDIVEVELKENNVYIQAKNGDIWRVSIEWDGLPVIECVAKNAPLDPGQTSG